ncbi:putative transporter SEO1 [Colletotrichum siamense]|nr:putative transporter SEO1 [Colletotrichum siamense]
MAEKRSYGVDIAAKYRPENARDADRQEDTDDSPEEHRPNRNFSKKSFFAWFDRNDGPLERRVILKLDFFILTYAFVGFWILYIDRGILTNAYISGMREAQDDSTPA